LVGLRLVKKRLTRTMALQVLEKIGSETQVVDARGAGRFLAKEPVRHNIVWNTPGACFSLWWCLRFASEMQEPRPGMRSGHIPGSANVPFVKLVSPDDFSVISS